MATEIISCESDEHFCICQTGVCKSDSHFCVCPKNFIANGLTSCQLHKSLEPQQPKDSSIFNKLKFVYLTLTSAGIALPPLLSVLGLIKGRDQTILMCAKISALTQLLLAISPKTPQNLITNNNRRKNMSKRDRIIDIIRSISWMVIYNLIVRKVLNTITRYRIA